jgi:hypothetical protein
MKPSDSLAGGQALFSLWTSRFASATVLAALALIAAPAAKADVFETFNLSGNFNSFPFPTPVAFTGPIDVDFSDNFATETVQSISITVDGRPLFNESPAPQLAFARSNLAVIDASNSIGDTLTLAFATAQAASLAGFDEGGIDGGEVIFSGLTGALLNPIGVVTRDPSGPVIPDPPPVDPPDPPTLAVPELSTWAMMLIGLAGLGLAAKGRRALGVLRRGA